MNIIIRLISLSALGILLVNGNTSMSYADEGDSYNSDPKPPHRHCPHPTPTHTPCPCPTPTPPPCPGQKQEHFNIQCTFSERDHDHGGKFKKCKAFADFEKMVTLDGGEVTDDSEYPFNPKFEIECDDEWIQKGPSRRFTEILGTRIQAEQGPFPALVLPRGALHVGPHSSDARLEFTNQTMNGSCFIYSGQSLQMN